MFIVSLWEKEEEEEKETLLNIILSFCRNSSFLLNSKLLIYILNKIIKNIEFLKEIEYLNYQINELLWLNRYLLIENINPSIYLIEQKYSICRIYAMKQLKTYGIDDIDSLQVYLFQEIKDRNELLIKMENDNDNVNDLSPLLSLFNRYKYHIKEDLLCYYRIDEYSSKVFNGIENNLHDYMRFFLMNLNFIKNKFIIIMYIWNQYLRKPLSKIWSLISISDHRKVARNNNIILISRISKELLYLIKNDMNMIDVKQDIDEDKYINKYKWPPIINPLKKNFILNDIKDFSLYLERNLILVQLIEMILNHKDIDNVDFDFFHDDLIGFDYMENWFVPIINNDESIVIKNQIEFFKAYILVDRGVKLYRIYELVGIDKEILRCEHVYILYEHYQDVLAEEMMLLEQDWSSLAPKLIPLIKKRLCILLASFQNKRSIYNIIISKIPPNILKDLETENITSLQVKFATKQRSSFLNSIRILLDKVVSISNDNHKLDEWDLCIRVLEDL